jgi:thiamine biosynthesis protein ThiS
MKTTTTFFLNGKEYIIDQRITLSDVVNYFDYNQSLLVLEHNKFICQKKDWSRIYIENKDTIEIVTIVGGG